MRRGLLPTSSTSTLFFSVSLSPKPIRVWVPGTAHKGLRAMIKKEFPKQAFHIQALQRLGWRPGYSISRKIATSFDKTPLVLTPPWLRESGWVCAGGQVEVGRAGGRGRQFLKFSWNVRNTKQPMFTQSFPNREQLPSSFKNMATSICPMKWLLSLTEIVPGCSHSPCLLRLNLLI